MFLYIARGGHFVLVEISSIDAMYVNGRKKKRMASHAFSHYTRGYKSCLWTHDHVPKLAKKCQSLATLLKFLVCKE